MPTTRCPALVAGDGGELLVVEASSRRARRAPCTTTSRPSASVMVRVCASAGRGEAPSAAPASRWRRGSVMARILRCVAWRHRCAPSIARGLSGVRCRARPPPRRQFHLHLPGAFEAQRQRHARALGQRRVQADQHDVEAAGAQFHRLPGCDGDVGAPGACASRRRRGPWCAVRPRARAACWPRSAGPAARRCCAGSGRRRRCRWRRRRASRDARW